MSPCPFAAARHGRLTFDGHRRDKDHPKSDSWASAAPRPPFIAKISKCCADRDPGENRLAQKQCGQKAGRLIAGGKGIHWPDLDEDISIARLLAGRRSGEAQESLRRWIERREAAA